MLALDSAKSGNQKVQVLRAVTFNSIGKGTPKVTLLRGLSSFSTFLHSTSFGAQHFFFFFLVFLFQCENRSWNTRGFSLASESALSSVPSTWQHSTEVCQLTHRSCLEEGEQQGGRSSLSLILDAFFTSPCSYEIIQAPGIYFILLAPLET